MWINSSNYKEYLKGICIVEVSGESCANCLSLMPILHSLVSQRNDCKLFHIEAKEDTMDLIEKYEIEAVPSILVLYNDELYVKCRGYQPEEILEIWLDAKIEELKKLHNIK
ncbi:MAG: thioredoxin family protein [Acholeplasmatales bacterium]|nr:thioredoxin family protein [Acholeplasmatales bacterium]